MDHLRSGVVYYFSCVCLSVCLFVCLVLVACERYCFTPFAAVWCTDTKSHVCKHMLIILSSRIRIRVRIRGCLKNPPESVRLQDFEIRNNTNVCIFLRVVTSGHMKKMENRSYCRSKFYIVGIGIFKTVLLLWYSINQFFIEK